MQLFGHPFSSYSWKAQIALDEKNLSYAYRNVDPAYPNNDAELRRRWPLGKFPLLEDGERVVFETSAIIEYLEARFAEAPRLIPPDPLAAVEVRMLDRVFDSHVMAPMQQIVSDALRPIDQRDAYGVERAREALDAIYAWLDARAEQGEWAAGDTFTLADCAAAPALFYADWAHPINGRFPAVSAYRARLLARPSVARAVEGGRPYRGYFPLGAPDRD
ncbi:glutathione S-transferase family protein [Sphingomonas sp.]|uniref:glutathione S-transferase family protein n=1 Tax=Sphingomonas sp. TaxID=28214 RepID=UPI0035C78D7B